MSTSLAAAPTEGRLTASNDREELRALVRLAVPLVIGQLGWSLMNFMDTVVLMQVNKGELGGAGLGIGAYFITTVPGLGLLMGFDPLIAQAIGAGDRAKARSWMWQAFYVAAVAGLVLMGALFVFRAVLPATGVASDVVGPAGEFILWRSLSLPFTLFFVVCRSYLQAISRARVVGVAAIVCNVFNFAGDWLLIFGGQRLPQWCGPLRAIPPMGAAGSALASTLCTILQFAMVAVVVARALREEGAVEVPRPAPRTWLPATRVGAPIALQLGAEMGVFVLAAFLAARIDSASSGAHHIVISFASLSFNVALGLAQAGSVRVGWAVGAGDAPAVRRSGRVALIAGGGVMVLSALVFVLLPTQLLAFFNVEPQVAQAAMPLMFLAGVFQVGDGLQAVGAGILRGAGDTFFASMANVVGHYFVGLPVSLWLGFGVHLALPGVWMGLCAGLFVVAALLVGRFAVLTARPIRALA